MWVVKQLKRGQLHVCLWHPDIQATTHNSRREVIKNGYFTVRLCFRERGGVNLLGPDRQQMWKFWPIFSIEILFFDTQDKFYLISQKCIFHAIFMVANDRPEGTGLLQMIVYRGQPLANDYPESCLFLVICSLSGVKHTTKKTRKTDSKVEGVCVCVNAYGQPDHKISVFFWRLPLHIGTTSDCT